MNRVRIQLASLLVLVAAALLAAPAANAYSTRLNATVRRSGHAVGTAHGTLVLASNGWSVVGVRVTGFRAPRSDHGWKVRTILSSSCTDPGYDPSADDGTDFHLVRVLASSPWRTTHLSRSTGSLTTNDFVKECPSGQVPGSSLSLSLFISDATSGTNAGGARLFSAG
jgi:hypothetical protein